MKKKEIADKKIFLQIALDDLKASKTLYKNSFYPQAVFYFEQSVEKTCKFILLDHNIIDISELTKRIRHNSMMVFKHYTEDLINKFSSIYSLKDIPENAENISNRGIFFPKKLVDNLQKSLKDIESQSKLRFKVMKQSDFDLCFTMLKYFSGEPFSELKTEHTDFFRLNPETVIDFIIDDLNLNESQRKFLQEKMNEGEFKKDLIANLRDKITSTQQLVRNEQILMVLARIFSSHSETTRYPDEDLSKNPQSIYNESNVLVKNLNKLYPYQEKALLYFNNNGSC